MPDHISVTEAIRRIVENRASAQTKRLPLNASLGHICAKPVHALVALPPADVSAMDGYAVRLQDVGSAGTRLEIVGEASAGTPFPRKIEQGKAARIFTGGVLPDGADHVVIQENTARDGNYVICKTAETEPRHIRPAAGDFAPNDLLIDVGQTLTPAHLGLAAAANHTHLDVARTSHVAILANGDELRPPGSPLEAGQISSSNPTALAALIRSWGGEVSELGIAPDNVDALKAHIKSAADADIILAVGGASVGDKDLMRPAFAALGFQSIFEKIQVKPGKPTWFGSLGDQRVLGLPGNPSAAFIGAMLYLRPLLGLCDELELIDAYAQFDLPASGPRETFLQARWEAKGGALSVTPLGKQSSATVSGLTQANCLIQRPASAAPISRGDLVPILILKTGAF